MVLNFNKAIQIAKDALEKSNYAYYVITEAIPQNGNWIVKVNAIANKLTITIDQTGQVIGLTSDT